jgi:hypothetical protein
VETKNYGQRERENVNFFDDHRRERETESDPPATRFYVISAKDMQINVLINNRFDRRLATGRRFSSHELYARRET